MTFIYVSYPDYIDNSTKWDNLKNKRLHYAISLLKKEKVSFGKAVEISGLSNAEFMGKLKERGIKWK
jgi:predicted HTH domain antitoxin